MAEEIKREKREKGQRSWWFSSEFFGWKEGRGRREEKEERTPREMRGDECGGVGGGFFQREESGGSSRGGEEWENENGKKGLGPLKEKKNNQFWP